MIRTAALLAVALAFSACHQAPAPVPPPRSMIVVTVDTLRADHVNATVAPALDRLARESVRFDTAVTVAPVTLPAHASLLTGTYPPAHGVRDNQIFSLAPNTATYTAWLKGRGYATGAFVSAVVLDHRYGLNNGFDTYDDEMNSASERSARETLDRAERWVGAARQPFFLWIHLFEPHAPYVAGSYAAEVTAVDTELDRFFNALRGRGIWDNLVVSVTSDHGESLGEHGESTHGYFVYDATVRIPWILKAPGVKARQFGHQVRIVDVLPTMIALSGAAPSGESLPGDVDGVNLVPFLDTGDSPRLEAYAESWLPRHQFNWSELKSIRTERFKYIEAPEPELYDLTADRSEKANALSANQDAATAMKSTLAAIERAHPQAGAVRRDVDPVMAEKFMALGYIGSAGDSGRGSTQRLADPKRKIDVYELTMSAYELAGRNKPEEAIGVLRRAEKIDPNVTQVHYLIGTILGTQHRYAEAAAALERASALNPRFVPARFKLALAYLRLGQHDRAEKDLRAVLENEPRNVGAIHNLAAIAYSRGDVRRAEELERQVISIDANYYDAWNTLGAIYVVSKRPAEAIEALNTAIRLNPSSGQAHYNLALALRANGEADRASDAARKACSLDPRFCGNAAKE